MAPITALLWMSCTYFNNYGLILASVTSAMVLFNTAPVWVYALSLSKLVPLAHREKFDFLKSLMIFLLIAGFLIIALQDY